jgi:glycosyltransferase involved in cell wall biosynthesis
VIPTCNRAESVQRAVEDVLAQQFADFEVIVVVDGSTDSTVADLSRITDLRLSVVARERGGPCRARNAGAAAAQGEWLAFLDDDDRVTSEWLAVFDEHSRASDVGVVSCAVARVDDRGGALRVATPGSLGPLYGNIEAHFFAGTFAVRKALFDEAGGYDPLMTHGENVELGLRLTIVCQAHRLRVTTDPRVPVYWTLRPKPPPSERAHAIHGAAVRMLDSHAERLRSDRVAWWTTLSVAGVNAARLGLIRDARHYLARAARVRPGHPKSWLRLAAVLSPRFAGRVWRDD